MSTNKTLLPDYLIKPLQVFMPLYSLFIFWASLRPSLGEQVIPHLDKLMHFGVYGLLALGFNFAWPNFSKIKIWIGCLVFGGIIEIAQGTLTHNRTPSFLDFVSNGLGAAIALLFALLISHKFAR